MSAENFIFINVFAVNVDGSDVYPGIYLYKNLFTDSWEDEIFEILLQFFSGEFKDYKYVKISTDITGTLTTTNPRVARET